MGSGPALSEDAEPKTSPPTPEASKPITVVPKSEENLNESQSGLPIKLTAEVLEKILSIPGQQIAQTRLCDDDWQTRNSAFITNHTEFAPFKSAFVSWDAKTGRVEGIILYLTVAGRPSHESDPYFTAEEILTRRFGPSKIRNFNLNLLVKDEAEWQLSRTGIVLKRIPRVDGQRETVDYELGVIAKDDVR